MPFGAAIARFKINEKVARARYEFERMSPVQRFEAGQKAVGELVFQKETRPLKYFWIFAFGFLTGGLFHMFAL